MRERILALHLKKIRTSILSLLKNWPVIGYSCLSGNFDDQINTKNGSGDNINRAPVFYRKNL